MIAIQLKWISLAQKSPSRINPLQSKRSQPTPVCKVLEQHICKIYRTQALKYRERLVKYTQEYLEAKKKWVEDNREQQIMAMVTGKTSETSEFRFSQAPFVVFYSDSDIYLKSISEYNHFMNKKFS